VGVVVVPGVVMVVVAIVVSEEVSVICRMAPTLPIVGGVFVMLMNSTAVRLSCVLKGN